MVRWLVLAGLFPFVVAAAERLAISGPEIVRSHDRLPLRFEANRGQSSPEARFLVRESRFTLFLASHEMALAGPGIEPLKIRLVGADPAARGSGEGPQAGWSYYYFDKKRVSAEVYSRVEFQDVYPGVSVAYYGNGGRLEYDFVVAPGAAAGAIEMAFEGVKTVRLDGRGDLLLRAERGEVLHRRPTAYQIIDGRRRSVVCRFVIRGPRRAGFELGAWDRTQPLVIDPVMVYSTYLGGRSDDRPNGVAVDSEGCAYIVGETRSADFPGVGGAQLRIAGDTDVFVAKLNAAGSALLYSAYIGGRSRDAGAAIAVDAAGNAYVSGVTYSSDFPVTGRAFQGSMPGSPAAFAFKLSSTGADLLYSTYLGGAATATSIAIDAAGSSYVSGYTSSISFPVTVGALQTAFAGGFWDGFVSKLNSDGSALVYSTYLGGSGADVISGIVVDAAGSAYVTGQTDSLGFPTRNALRASYSGNTDAFVAKLNSAGSDLIYSTYLGGSGPDYASAIAVDGSGSVYVTGATFSGDFPVTAGAFQATKRGSYDAFVAKLSSTGGALAYSTFLGGRDADSGAGIAVDRNGFAHVAGATWSLDFPVKNATQAVFHGVQDAFLSVIAPDGGALTYSIYMGGAAEDFAQGVALDPLGRVVLVGSTASTDFGTTAAAYQPTAGGRIDGFVVSVSMDNASPQAVSVSPSSGSGSSQLFTFVYSDPDGFADLSYVQAIFSSTLNPVGACYLHYHRGFNLIDLFNDAGTGAVGPVPMGGAGTLQNSQCLVQAGPSSVSFSGDTMTLRLAVTFQPGFAGAKSVFLRAVDTHALDSGWQNKGMWTVP